mgnify:FL=1
MASLYEQMDNLLTPNSFKEGLAKSAEENKDMNLSDTFSFDRFKKEALPQFREKDEIIEKATATGTGLLTGTLGLPSDIISMASAGADLVGGYTNNPTFTVVKDLLNRAEKESGRPAFDKWFTETTGLESNPANTDQLIGEILSPTGAFLVPLKTLNKLFKPLKKGVSEFFDNLPDGTGGAKLVEEGPSASNINKTSTVDDFNQPTINLSEVGIKAPDGARAATRYEKLEADAMGGVYDKENGSALYAELSLNEKDRLFKETGVYRGLEGKLRYKIPTGDAQLNQGYLRDLGVIEGGGNTGIIPTFNTSKIPSEGLSIKEILNFEDLYRNYGSVKSNGNYGLLENIKVKSFDSYIEELGLGKEAMTDLKNTQAIYSRHEGVETIYIKSGKNIKATKDDILHEIQHAIQHREGFIAGSSPERFLNDMSTEFGQTYTGLVKNINTEKRNALSTFQQIVGEGGVQTNRQFLENAKLFESLTDKLVKREYNTLLEQYNKTDNSTGYFRELPTNIRFFEENGVNLGIELPVNTRFDGLQPRKYEGYNLKPIRFTEKERLLNEDVYKNKGFQDYIRERIITEHKVRNVTLLEAEAHEAYLKVGGEVQARKIVEDNDLYNYIKGKMGYKSNDIVPKEVQEEIFRQIKPSPTGLLEGQTIKPQGSNVDIST